MAYKSYEFFAPLDKLRQTNKFYFLKVMWHHGCSSAQRHGWCSFLSYLTLKWWLTGRQSFWLFFGECDFMKCFLQVFQQVWRRKNLGFCLEMLNNTKYLRFGCCVTPKDKHTKHNDWKIRFSALHCNGIL